MRKLLFLFTIILLFTGCRKISEEEEMQRYYNNKANTRKRQEKYQKAMDGFFQLEPNKHNSYEQLLIPNKQTDPGLKTSIPKTNITTGFPKTTLTTSLPTHTTTTNPFKTNITTSFPKTNAPLSAPTLDRRRRQDF